MPDLIEINGEKVPIKITPKDLQMEFDKTYSRNGQKSKFNTFRTNPLKLIQFLCNIYGVKFVLEKSTNSNNAIKYVSISIPAMKIYVGAIGESFRKAKIKLIFKLHHVYTNKIIKDSNIV